MRITKVKISNFRLLRQVKIDLEENLSLIIGKNNTGKTSVVHILDKFLNNSSFAFEDFNVKLCKRLSEDIEKNLQELVVEPDTYESYRINLQVYIEYSEEDDLSHIAPLIMDLDPDQHIILLSFDYLLKFEKFRQLIEDFRDRREKINRNEQQYLRQNSEWQKNHDFGVKLAPYDPL